MHLSRLVQSVVVVLLLAMTPIVVAQDAAKPAPQPAAEENPFNKLDPEVKTVMDTDFSKVDLTTVDARTRVIAGIALQDLSNLARNKAEHRMNMMLQFIQDKNLSEKYATTPPSGDFEPLSFADAQKFAVAYVQTEAGEMDYAGKLTTDDPSMIAKMITAYDAMNQKTWDEMVGMRREVDRAAKFLESEKRFDEFMGWAQLEAKNQADADAQEMERRQYEYAQRMERERAERMKIAEANNQRAHEERMKRLELSYDYKTAKLNAQRDVAVSYNQRYSYNGGGWYYSDDYYRNGYRGVAVYRGGVNRGGAVYRR